MIYIYIYIKSIYTHIHPCNGVTIRDTSGGHVSERVGEQPGWGWTWTVSDMPQSIRSADVEKVETSSEASMKDSSNTAG